MNRIIVGTRDGLRDWVAQRITALIMALYSAVLAVVLLSRQPVDYGGWRELFAQGWMRAATLLFAASLAWHAWVGMRDILIDYVNRAGLRRGFLIMVLLVIAGYLGWIVRILWR